MFKEINKISNRRIDQQNETKKRNVNRKQEVYNERKSIR